MDDFEDDCNSNGGENWIQSQKYTNWEMECINRLETTPDLEQQIELEKGGNAQKLWTSFQTAACNIAQLYQVREQHQSNTSWMQFQTAASAVTTLYKDCIESQKRFSESGFQSGQQKRNKEFLAWIKKRKRNIRREDLIAFLSGANTQSPYGHPFHQYYHHSHHRTWSSPKQRLSVSDSTGRSAFTRLSLSDSLTTDPNSQTNIDTSNSDETDLETFREALALSGLRSSPQQSNSSSRKSSIIRVSNNSMAELNAFINEEYNRHVESRKRASGSVDVNMDSPTHKRSKLT